MRPLIVLYALCSIVTATSVEARDQAASSWGKAGVPLEQYVQDGAECAETSRYVTTYIKPDTLKRLSALSSAQLLDAVMKLGGNRIGFNSTGFVEGITTLRSTNEIARRSNTFSAQYESIISFDVRDQLQAVLNKCLVERGYVHIWLTKSQQTAMRQLKRGSQERTIYLHSIGSDATLVTQQQSHTNGA